MYENQDSFEVLKLNHNHVLLVLLVVLEMDLEQV